MPPFRGKGDSMNESPAPAPCQVRRKTESPCPHPAGAEIRGVAFCGPCAREQEAYFAIGELVAREEARGHRGKPLAEALRKMRRERVGGMEGIAAETHHGPSSAYGTKPLAFSSRLPRGILSAATLSLRRGGK